MKKIALMTALFVACLSGSALAGTINTGQSTSCVDANSITVEVAKISNKAGGQFGYTTNDRGTANLTVWRSSNAITLPLTLGPNDDNRSLNGKDKGRTGFDRRGSMGKNKVVLTGQNNFSRGDSIGDISGTVRFTNTGTNPVTVTCN